MLPSEWVWLRQHQHSQAGNAARAGVWAGWEEQGQQLSNSTTTVTNDTDLDFARNKRSRTEVSSELGHIFASKKVNILGSGEAKETCSLRTTAVKFWLSYSSHSENSWETFDCPSNGVELRGTRPAQSMQEGTGDPGPNVQERQTEERAVGEEKAWTDVWSKRNLTINETPTSCEATCLQGLHRL